MCPYPGGHPRPVSLAAHLFADSGYNGPNLRATLVKFGNWTIEIVKRTAPAAGF
jgi:transposase